MQKRLERCTKIAGAAYAATAAFLFVLICMGCTRDITPPEKSPKTQNTDEFVFAFDYEPGALDPQSNLYLSGMAVQNLLFDTLITRGEDGSFSPSLAENWERIDDLTLRFYLRRDVKFHGGDRFTAEDVKFTLERMATEENSREIYERLDVQNTRMRDEYTVDVVFKGPVGDALTLLSGARAAVVPRGYFESVGAVEFGETPVGTGPFKFVSRTREDGIKLERTGEHFEHNNGGVRYFRAVFAPDETVRADMLKSGLADAAVARSEQAGEDYLVYSCPGFRSYSLRFNLSGRFADPRLRRAISFVPEQERLVAESLGERGFSAMSLFPPGTFGAPEYNGEYSPSSPDAESIAELTKGEPYTLLVPRDPDMVKMAEGLRDMWAAAGISVELEIVDQGTYSVRVGAGEFEFYLATGTVSTGDPYGIFEHLIWPEGGLDSEPYERIKEMLNAARETVDDSVRAQKYAELQKYVLQNSLEVPLAGRYSRVVYREYVSGIGASPVGISDFRRVVINAGEMPEAGTGIK